MWLVLTGERDPSAAWAAEGLRQRGLAPVELVRSGDLDGATWNHRVGSHGARIEIALRDGRRIVSGRVRGVLNRIVQAPPETIRGGARADQEYALSELTAFYMSWLRAFPGPVLGRPTPQGLCGRWRPASEWAVLAAQAGLPTPRHVQGTAHGEWGEQGPPLVDPRVPIATVVVVGGRASARRALAPLAGACAKLARLAGADVLGVEVARLREGMAFAGATPLPDLRAGGPGVLDAIASSLREQP